jgi:hypothetical protein
MSNVEHNFTKGLLLVRKLAAEKRETQKRMVDEFANDPLKQAMATNLILKSKRRR